MGIPHKISDILPQLFKDDQQWKYQLLSNWQNIFGNMSDKIYLERINTDTLILAVYDACWMQELYTMTPLLITSINKTLDKPYVKQLRFKRAGIRQKKESSITKQKIEKPHKPIILTISEEKALASIKDQELAKVMKDFLIRCYYEQELYKETKINKP